MKEKTFKDRLKNIIDSDTTAQIFFCAICASLFTYGLCFPLINEYVAGAFMAVFVVYECLRQRYVPLDLATLFLFQGLLICALIDFHTNDQYMYWLQWAWALPLAYLLGKVTAKSLCNNAKQGFISRKLFKETEPIVAMLCLSLGLYIQGILDFQKGYIDTQGYMTDYQWKQFWVTTELQPRTTYEFEFILMTSLVVLALYCLKKQPIVSGLLFVCEAIVQFYCLKSDGRTNFCHLAVAVFIAILLFTYDNRATQSKKKLKFLAILGGTVVLLIVVGAFLLQANAFGLKDYYNNSFWNRDGGLIHNVRFEAFAEAFQLLLKNPLGGFEGTKLPAGSSHNLWLEYSRHYGLVPFVCIYIFKLITIFYTIRLALDKAAHSRLVRYVLVPAFIAVNLYYSMEPNGFANRNYWFFGLFISGLIAEVVHSENKVTYIKASGLRNIGEKR